jgi:hypothetical protein
MKVQPEPGSFWRRDPDGPFTERHAQRRRCALQHADRLDPVGFIPAEGTPPYADLDAAVARAISEEDFSYASRAFSSVIWAWRDVSSTRRRLAEACVSHAGGPSALTTLFELTDALPMFDIQLSPVHRGSSLFFERFAALSAALEHSSHFSDGASAWWLVLYSHEAHHRAIAALASPPPLVEWLEEIPEAVQVLKDDEHRELARALSSQLRSSPLELAQVAAAI